MKTIPVSLIIAGILVPVVSLAQTDTAPPPPTPGEQGGKRGPQRPFPETWKAADTNHDGFISKEEFDVMPRIQNLPEEKRLHLFERLDKDGDGKLSREELARMLRPHDGQPPTLQRLWELDVDKSGGISLEEFKAGQLFKKLPPERQEELFRRLDTDHDGLITPKDKPAPPFKRDGNARPQAPEGTPQEHSRFELRQLLRQLDTNADGSISLDEFKAGPMGQRDPATAESYFKMLDKDSDGKVTLDEFNRHGQ